MVKTKAPRIKANWKEILKEKGWKENSYGHLHKISKEGKEYRYKVQKNSIRVEVMAGRAYQYGDIQGHETGQKLWVRITTYLLPKGA